MLCQPAKKNAAGVIPPRPRLSAAKPPGAGGGETPPPRTGLEVQLQPDLHYAWVEGRGELTEVAGAEVVADLVELRVVPGVERFGTELQAAAASFAEHEALEQREVPVVAARTTCCVVAEVAEGTDRGIHERSRVDVLDDLLSRRANRIGIGDLSREVRTVGCVGQPVAALAAAEADVDGDAGFHGDDAGHFPAAKRGANQAVLVVAEERNVVDEVHYGIVSPVVSAWANVILPAEVRIRNVLEVLAAGAAGARVDGLGVGVEGAEEQILAYLRVDVQLQTIVVRVGFVGGETDGTEARI